MKRLIPISGVILIAGCSSAPKQTVVRIEEPAGTTPIHEEAASSYRTAERVAVYSVGRTRDAADPNIMHLEHQVVRVEKPPEWVKVGGKGEEGIPAAQEAPEDPVMEKAAEPTAADLELKIKVVDQVMEKLDERNQVLVNKLDSFAKATEEANRLKEENMKLKAEQDDLKTRLEKLEEKEKKPWWKIW